MLPLARAAAPAAASRRPVHGSSMTRRSPEEGPRSRSKARSSPSSCNQAALSIDPSNGASRRWRGRRRTRNGPQTHTIRLTGIAPNYAEGWHRSRTGCSRMPGRDDGAACDLPVVCRRRSSSTRAIIRGDGTTRRDRLEDYGDNPRALTGCTRRARRGVSIRAICGLQRPTSTDVAGMSRGQGI